MIDDLRFAGSSAERPLGGKGIFFFHLPKCAGTSLWSALRDLVGEDKAFQVGSPEQAQRFRDMPAQERSRYAAIGGHYDLSLYRTHLDLRDYVCVTTFRQPVERILSEYHYASRNPKHSHHSTIARLSLEEFIEWDPNPVTRLICGEADADAAVATVREVFDHWAFVDGIDDLVTALYRKAGRPARSAPYLNDGAQFGQRAIPSPELDPKLLDRIRKYHQADIELVARLAEQRGEARLRAGAGVARSRPAPTFHVVTPVLNNARYLDEAIESVVRQAGNFTIRYHIQDGGSSDDTLAIARRWQSRLEARDFPQGCKGICLTVDSRPDSGMYDAIANGFRSLAPADSDLMTWINADDRLAVGAFEAVADAFHDLPLVELIGGRQALIDEDRVRPLTSMITYPRKCVAAGLHDGRHLPFVMQEGTFWRAGLWHRVGGLDTSFKLAGDWDLWRRFAAQTDFVTLDLVTGYHRRRSGQLTESLAAYHGEVDSRMARDWVIRDRVYRQYRKTRRHSAGSGAFSVQAARRDDAGKWILLDWEAPKPLRRDVSFRSKPLKWVGIWLQRSYYQVAGLAPGVRRRGKTPR